MKNRDSEELNLAFGCQLPLGYKPESYSLADTEILTVKVIFLSILISDLVL